MTDGNKHPNDSRGRIGSGSKGAGGGSSFQEQKNYRREPAHNRPKTTAMDGIGCEQYALSVEVLVSDKRRRDLDGALATICDCLVAARRQLESYTDDNGKGKDGKKRR